MVPLGVLSGPAHGACKCVVAVAIWVRPSVVDAFRRLVRRSLRVVVRGAVEQCASGEHDEWRLDLEQVSVDADERVCLYGQRGQQMVVVRVGAACRRRPFGPVVTESGLRGRSVWVMDVSFFRKDADRLRGGSPHGEIRAGAAPGDHTGPAERRIRALSRPRAPPARIGGAPLLNAGSDRPCVRDGSIATRAAVRSCRARSARVRAGDADATLGHGGRFR